VGKFCFWIGFFLIPFASFSSIHGLSAQPDNSKTDRHVEDNMLTSKHLPSIRIQFDNSFTYIGNVEFILKNIAKVDRRHFVVTDNKKRIQQMIVVQFEDILDGADFTYEYSYKNPVILGGQKYKHNTWFYNNAENVKENPGAEADRTMRLLKAKGYHLEDELMMSRFVRDYGKNRQNEIIIFYFENLKDTGFNLADFSENGQAENQYDPIAKALTERSLKSFTILED